MAAASPPHSGRQFAQGEDGGSWGHKKNNSQDSRQNFSYPTAYTQNSPQQSPRSPEEFVTPTSTFPSDGAASGFNFGDSAQQPSSTVLSDRAVNRFDNPKSRYPVEPGRNNSYGDIGSDVSRHTKGSYSVTAPGKKQGQNRLLNPEDDKSNWIHRDKLTAIEIQEHIALGKAVPPELFKKLEDRQKSGQSRNTRPSNTPTFDEYNDQLAENKRPRIHSPSPEAPTYEYEDDDEPFVPIDPRSPEEIAADWDNSNTMYQQNRLRSSSSRIPLSTTSPLPVPQEHLDRNTRIPRKRSVSNTHDQDALAYPKLRPRSPSAGSQVFVDDDTANDPPGSPPKGRAPSKGAPTGRKGSSTARSTSASASKNRSASSGPKNSPAARPSTRDGRPSPHRVEGDPPWLATMYKPDPRLPPDQQMLPTHAKRMMQEHWEKEGTPGQSYDREFRPVAPYPEDEKAPSSQEPPELEPENAQQGLWPKHREPSPEHLNLQLSPQLSQGSRRNQQSPHRAHQGNGEAHGGYSTIPKIQSTPVLGSQSPRPDNRERFDVEEQKEDKKKGGGCGCCVVM